MSMALSRSNDDVAVPAAIQIGAALDTCPATDRWIATLPPDFRPVNLLNQLPRVANALATRWPSKLACRTVLYEVPAQLARAKGNVGTEITREVNTLLSYLEEL